MRRRIILILVLVIIFLLTINGIKELKEKEVREEKQTKIENILPSGWEKSETQEGIKISKKVESGLVPMITLEKTENEEEFVAYTNKLIAGAKAAIPSLKYIGDKISEDKNGRFLEGFYYNQKKRVVIKQNLYQKEKYLYTITASFENQEMSGEINKIFERLVQENGLQ